MLDGERDLEYKATSGDVAFGMVGKIKDSTTRYHRRFSYMPTFRHLNFDLKFT